MISVTVQIDDITVTVETGDEGGYAPDICHDITNRAVTALNQAAAVQLAQYRELAALNIVPTRCTHDIEEEDGDTE